MNNMHPLNRKAKYIKKLTYSDMAIVRETTPENRVKLCNPSTPQGFLRFYTHYFSDTINFPHAQFHYDVMEALWLMIQSAPDLNPKYKTDIQLEENERIIDEILFIGFRECAKTSMFKAFLTYCICYNLRSYPNVDAYDQTNSERILFDIVFNLQLNQRIISDFGNLYSTERTRDEADQKRISDFVTNKVILPDGKETGRIRVEAHSTQSPVRGRQHNNKRPDLLWLEDFETEDTITSEAKTSAIERHIASFKGGLADTGNMKIYSANYLTEYGNVQALIDKSKVSENMLAFIIPIYTDDMEITWSEKYVMTNEEVKDTGKISIQKKKQSMWSPTKGDISFTMEMLCKPIDITRQEFKQEMFKSITWDELAQIQTVLYVTIDSGGSSKETQRRKQGEVDDTGVCFNYIDKFGNWYLKTWGKKMDAKEILELIFSIHLGYKNLEYIGIEETMFVEAIKPFYDEAKRNRNQYPKLKMLRAGGRNKENRIRGLIPRYEAGVIYHIKGENQKLEEQLLRFPRAKHDDVSDAVAYQNDIAKTPIFPESKINSKGFYEVEEQNDSPYSAIGL